MTASLLNNSKTLLRSAFRSSKLREVDDIGIEINKTSSVSLPPSRRSSEVPVFFEQTCFSPAGAVPADRSHERKSVGMQLMQSPSTSSFTSKPRIVLRRQSQSEVQKDTPHFYEIANTVLGWPITATSDLPVAIDTDMVIADGAFDTVPITLTVTRPPSPLIDSTPTCFRLPSSSRRAPPLLNLPRVSCHVSGAFCRRQARGVRANQTARVHMIIPWTGRRVNWWRTKRVSSTMGLLLVQVGTHLPKLQYLLLNSNHQTSSLGYHRRCQSPFYEF
jgi:hypothetical protein